MNSAKVTVAFLFTLLVVTVANLHAQEQRCNQLGTNCVCSEPLNTTSLVYTSPYYNPGDSVTKECTVASPGTTITRNSNDLFGSNNPSVLSALPSGNSVNYVLSGPDGHLNMFYLGHFYGSQYMKRVAIRWYLYHSPNYEFSGEAQCLNSKLANFGAPALLDKQTGRIHMYSFVPWSPSVTCCMSGPGAGITGIPTTGNSWRGKWWRIEVNISNRDGGSPGTVVKVYTKNITDNQPEGVAVDTTVADSRWPAPSNLSPPATIYEMRSNNHRYSPTGVCRGFNAISHYMAAGWDTDAGQRIGAASEIEGGAGSPPPAPTGPTSLIVQ